MPPCDVDWNGEKIDLISIAVENNEAEKKWKKTVLFGVFAINSDVIYRVYERKT